MNISANLAAAPLRSNTAEPAKKEYRVKSDHHHVADRFEDSRSLGNSVSGLITGATLETGIAALNSPKLAWEIAENVWQAETLGPNIKLLGTLGAIPGAALNILAAPFVGAFTGATLAGKASRVSEDVLPKDAAPEYTNRRFNEDHQTLTASLIERLEELGSAKLESGEKKFDIPLLSPVFAVIGGVISGGISGVVGLVAGLGAGLLTTGKEAIAGIKEGKVGRVLASPLHTVAIPYGMVKEGLKESVPRGLSDGWKHGPLKPVADTLKASAGLAGSVLKEAWER